MKINKKLIFIQSTYGDAHQMARCKELENHYMEFELLAFDREYYSATDDLSYTSLGKVSHGKYSKRILSYLNSIKLIRNKMSSKLENDVYFYGFDLLLFIGLFSDLIKAKLIFEIADIREVYFEKNLKSFFLTHLLRKSIFSVDALVVTSNLYIDFLVDKKKIPINNYFLIENKVHLNDNILSSDLNQLLSDKIVIGYFGLLRCNQSLKILLELVNNSKRFKVVIHGYFLNVSEKLIEKCKNHPRIEVYGEYKSPQDLPRIYDQIDISWTAYPYTNKKIGNFNLARTNRFYEAGFFCKPMIASKNTGDSYIINEKSLGIILDLSNISQSVELIRNINQKNIKSWKFNIQKCGIDSFKTTRNDYKELLKYLHQ